MVTDFDLNMPRTFFGTRRGHFMGREPHVLHSPPLLASLPPQTSPSDSSHGVASFLCFVDQIDSVVGAAARRKCIQGTCRLRHSGSTSRSGPGVQAPSGKRRTRRPRRRCHWGSRAAMGEQQVPQRSAVQIRDQVQQTCRPSRSSWSASLKDNPIQQQCLL